jgi:hypothetical protein
LTGAAVKRKKKQHAGMRTRNISFFSQLNFTEQDKYCLSVPDP